MQKELSLSRSTFCKAAFFVDLHGKSVGSFYFLSSRAAYGWPRMTMLCRLLPAAGIDTLICISPFIIFYCFIMERKNVREGGFLLENGMPFDFVSGTRKGPPHNLGGP